MNVDSEPPQSAMILSAQMYSLNEAIVKLERTRCRNDEQERFLMRLHAEYRKLHKRRERCK
jgi:hypothetical protein